MARPRIRRWPGCFVTFEGGEGAGKSTQLARLAAKLRSGGKDVVTTREPGGTPGAEAIRDLLVRGDVDRWTPLSEALLNFAARKDHLERLILPALTSGRWVLSDRFADSTMAYQGIAGKAGRSVIAALADMVIGDNGPDLTFMLDLPPDVGLARAAARANHENRFERKGAAFHRALRQAFLDIAADSPDRCLVIDAEQSEDLVAEQVWNAVRARLDDGRVEASP